MTSCPWSRRRSRPTFDNPQARSWAEVPCLPLREEPPPGAVPGFLPSAEVGGLAGLVTGFLGPNGAGKSTTMRKLGVRDRLQAAVAAYDAGLVRPHGS
jgi:hypothetical protein